VSALRVIQGRRQIGTKARRRAVTAPVVVVNDEENRREDADALAAAGVALHDMSPRAVADVGPAVAALAGAVGVRVPSPFGTAEWAHWLGAHSSPNRGSVAMLVWRRPWMTARADTYGASVLVTLGWQPVTPGGDVRYPEVSLDDLAGLRPDVVLLPSEPYPFGERHRPEVEQGVPDAAVALVDGRDLFWWGIRTPAAIERLGRVPALSGRSPR